MKLNLFVWTLLMSLAFSLSASAQFLSAEASLQILSANLKFDSAEEKASLAHHQTWIENGRRFTLMKLQAPEAGEFHVLVNSPADQQQKLPALVLFSGFQAGMESAKLIPNPGNLIVIGYHYPFSKEQAEKDPSLVLKMIRLAPAQMALALHWIQNQELIIADQVHVMGVSLGSLFLPVSLKLAEIKNFFPASTIFAYSGVGIQSVLANNMGNSFGLENLFLLHDPELYLPSLKGPFNCIYGQNDSIFPFETSVRQYGLLNGSKEVHWIPGGHIDLGKPELIEKTSAILIDFLNRQNTRPTF